MSNGSEQVPRLAPKWPACGQCARCCSGTGRRPTRDSDCLDLFFRAQSAAIGVVEPNTEPTPGASAGAACHGTATAR